MVAPHVKLGAKLRVCACGSTRCSGIIVVRGAFTSQEVGCSPWFAGERRRILQTDPGAERETPLGVSVELWVVFLEPVGDLVKDV